MRSPTRCSWVGSDPLLVAYHDEEWGVPELDSRALWEALVLGGFQAGLSWRTVLCKRDAFRAAFEGFDPYVVAGYGPLDVERLMRDPGIIRSQPKILGAIENARAYVTMEEAGEDLASLVWSACSGPVLLEGTPELATAVADALRDRGFAFIGPVVVHAWLRAAGAVYEHEPGCFRTDGVNALRPR